MNDEEEKKIDETSSQEQSTSTALTINTNSLKQESLEILNQLIVEQDQEKSKDLTYLFNQNQKKKTMVRQDKLNDLQDVLVDQAINRFTKKPDEIDNNTLINGLKTIQDIIERNNRIVNEQEEKPLIQINQQEVNINEGPNRESRDRIKNAVANILAGITNSQQTTQKEVIDADVVQPEEEENKND